jgi:uncharacterized protein (TIGR02118 family)
MTVKLVVLYTQPDDPDVFEQHYRDQHMPLVHALPGLQKVETGRIIAEADGGDALDTALGSKHGQAASADYAKIAPPGSRILVQSLDD